MLPVPQERLDPQDRKVTPGRPAQPVHKGLPAQVASLNNLPAGNYLLSAKATIGFNSNAGAQDLCTLSVGSTPIDYSYSTVSPSNGIFYETAKLLGTASLVAGSSVTVTCSTTSGTATAQYPVLTATLVGSITPM